MDTIHNMVVPKLPEKDDVRRKTHYPLAEARGGRLDELIKSIQEARRRRDPHYSPPERKTVPMTEQAPSAEAPSEKMHQLNSDNLKEAIETKRVKRTSTGLIDGAALFGSTHDLATWREESIVSQLSEAEITTYNPKIDPEIMEWNPELHPLAEALAMSEMSVLAMRIENNDLKDGSLGSMVEMGMAVLSAALNGQRVVVSLEDGIENSLEEPGALAQFVGMKNALNRAAEKYPHLITVQHGDDMEAFRKAIQTAVEEQRNPETTRQPMSAEAFQSHAEKKKTRLNKRFPIRISGGSSGPFTERDNAVTTSFQQEQSKIRSLWGKGLRALNMGRISKLWIPGQDELDRRAVEKLIGDAKTEEEVIDLTVAFSGEEGIKKIADVLIWSIQDEATSKAAITEIGFLLLDALESGQQMMLVLEPFDSKLYIDTVFTEKAHDFGVQAAHVESKALEDGKPFSRAEIEESDAIIQDLVYRRTYQVDLNRIKNNPILKKTQMFRDFDNVRRTRAVIEAQVSKLVESLNKRKDQIGEPFFTFATSVDEYMVQAEQVKKEMPFFAQAA